MLCASLLAVPRTVASQGASDNSVSEVVRRYLEAMRSKKWMGCALLAHPEELGRIRRDFLPVFARDSTGEVAEQILGVPRQLRVTSLDSVELAARLFGYYVRVTSLGSAFSVFQSPEVLGSLSHGPDSAVVVYRFRLPADSLPLRSWQTKLVRRFGSEWRIDMLADFSGMLRELARRR